MHVTPKTVDINKPYKRGPKMFDFRFQCQSLPNQIEK